MRTLILLFFFVYVIPLISNSQTTLAPGDIAFSGYISANGTGINVGGGNTQNIDSFSFVLLRNISSGTVIKFTDDAWLRTGPSSGSFAGVEGIITWTAGSAILTGTEVTVGIVFTSGPGGTTMNSVTFSINGTTNGTTIFTRIFSLATSGDQILAYQGIETAPTFVAAIHSNTYTGAVAGQPVTSDANWDGNYNTQNACGLPTGLTTGVNALWIGTQGDPTEYDNAAFNCNAAGIDITTVNSARIALNDKTKWSVNSLDFGGSAINLPTGCPYLINLAPAITTQPVSSTFCSGLSTSFNVVASGPNLSYQWQEATDLAFTSGLVNLTNTGVYTGTSSSTLNISNNSLLNGRYYRCIVSNTNGIAISGGALLTATANILPAGNTTVSQAIGTFNNVYLASACRILSRISPSGSNPVSGNVTAEVWVEPSVPVYNGQPYVERHYQITPAVNAGTATARITLFFSQTEFTNFNNHPASTLNLPTGPSDALGISNLRVSKFNGSSNNGTGLPGSYAGTASFINPADTDIVWDVAGNRWAVTFDVTGFSGFFVHTGSATLPATITSLWAKTGEKDIDINWISEYEDGVQEYEVQRSFDGSTFLTITKIPVSTSLSPTKQYSFKDVNAAPNLSKHIFYRLKILDLNNSFKYSEILTVKNTYSNKKIEVINLLNPVTNFATLNVYSNHSQLVHMRIISPDGNVISNDIKQLNSGINNIKFRTDMLTPGLYILQLHDGYEIATLKLIKR